MDSKKTQLVALVIGLVMALAGGAVKVVAVSNEPDIFSFAFFSGPAYLLLIAGLLLVVMAMGWERLFGPDEDGPAERQ